MFDREETINNLRLHVYTLTEEIGERSVSTPENLIRAQQYIESFYRDLGLPVHLQPYRYGNMTVANIVARAGGSPNPKGRYLVGAHYDSVSGTVGADDNASAVAVQLETARRLSRQKVDAGGVSVTFVSFALEEPPVYGTSRMGSRVYAREAKRKKERIDGIICLEMVGYTCGEPGCQSYPFPLMFLNYPKAGNFIGIVGNFTSRRLSRTLFDAFQRNPRLPAVRLTVPFGGWLMPSVRLSDHAPFWDQGYPAVMVTDSAFYRNPHYHLPSDTLETLDFSFMAELVESLTHFFSTAVK